MKLKYKHQKLRQIAHRIDAMSYRERILLAATALVITLFLWDSMLLQAQLDRRAALKTELGTVGTERITADALKTQLTQTLQLDPNAQEQIRLERYTQEIKRIDEILKSKTLEFVSPQQMVEVLKTLIDKEPGLQLTRLESTGPDLPLRAGVEQKKGDIILDTKKPNVYVHGLELSFSGDYFSTLRYVKQLESLQWRFGWAAMSLTMTKYPRAEVFIRLETLSLTEGWIGV